MGSLPIRCPVSCIPAATSSSWSFQQPLDPALNSGSAQSLSLHPQAPEVCLILTICPDFPYERGMFALRVAPGSAELRGDPSQVVALVRRGGCARGQQQPRVSRRCRVPAATHQ